MDAVDFLPAPLFARMHGRIRGIKRVFPRASERQRPAACLTARDSDKRRYRPAAAVLPSDDDDQVADDEDTVESLTGAYQIARIR